MSEFNAAPNRGRFSSLHQPANRGRKPKRQFRPMDAALEVALAKVRVVVNGRAKLVTREEARVMALVHKGLKGSVAAMGELIRMRRDAGLTALRRKLVIYMSEAEMRA